MDKVIKFLAYEKRVSIMCVDTKDLVEEIRKIHDLSPTMTAALGRFATVLGIMGHTSIKENDDKITVQLKGDGPAGSLIGIISKENNISKIKVYAQNPKVELPIREDGKLDVGGAVGHNGYLNIIKKNEIMDNEYTGIIPIVSGEIAEDFTRYYADSEQTPTVLALGVLVNKDGVKAAGGYIINLMPDAKEEDISGIENAIKDAPSISTLLDQNKSLEEIAKIVTGDENVEVLEDDLKIKFECDCSKSKFERGLIAIGKDDLNNIINEDGKADCVCHFCNKEYHFTKEELLEILNKI